VLERRRCPRETSESVQRGLVAEGRQLFPDMTVTE
jgi:ABC-type branched-subunit amino acid transport system ATPase component